MMITTTGANERLINQEPRVQREATSPSPHARSSFIRRNSISTRLFARFPWEDAVALSQRSRFSISLGALGRLEVNPGNVE